MNKIITTKQINDAAKIIGCTSHTVRKMIDVGGLSRDKDGMFLPEDLEFNRLFWEYNIAIRSADGYHRWTK